MTAQCSTCRFAARETGWQAFSCRRRAPIPVHDPHKNCGVYPEAFQPRWPRMDAEDWCGEHEPVHSDTGVRQVMQWAMTYVDGETCISEVPRDKLSPEERAGLEELERLGRMPLHSPTQTPR